MVWGRKTEVAGWSGQIGMYTCRGGTEEAVGYEDTSGMVTMLGRWVLWIIIDGLCVVIGVVIYCLGCVDNGCVGNGIHRCGHHGG